MKFCSHCGQRLVDEAAFCSSCGNAVATVQSPTPVETAPPVAPVNPAPVVNEPLYQAAPVAATYTEETAQLHSQEYVPQPVQPVKKSFLQKIKALSWKAWAAIAVAVVALGVGVWFLVDILTNTYETPVKLIIEQRNAKKFSWNLLTDSMNGFAEEEVKAIFDIMKKSDYADNFEDSFESSIEYQKEMYGDNYKYSYKIEDKDKLDKDELEEFEEQLNEQGESLIERMESTEDEDDYESAADSLGLSTSQTKKLIEAMKDFAKVLKKAKVTEGYELTITITLKGSELDEPFELETTIYVYKVNGRWISESALSSIPYLKF